jgi:hypothetical protein
MLVLLHILDRHNARLQCPEDALLARKSWITTLENKILQRVSKKYAATFVQFKFVGKIMGFAV